MTTEPITDAELERIEKQQLRSGHSSWWSEDFILRLIAALRAASAEHKAYVSLMVGTLADLGRETADIEAERDAALAECADVRAEHEKTRSAWAVLDKLTFKLMEERDAARAENAKLRAVVEAAKWAASCYSCSNDCGCAGCKLKTALDEAGHGD